MSDIFDHAADAYDDLFFGRSSDEEYYLRRSSRAYGYSYEPVGKTCKHCGKSNLFWHQYKTGWRLFDKGELHDCLNKHLTNDK